MSPLTDRNLLWLANETLELGLDPDTGTINVLRSADGSWSIVDRAAGMSFRLLVPLPGRRHNYVEGVDQPPSRHRVSADGREVCFEWDSVRSVHGGQHPIGITASVRLSDRRAVFTLAVRNDSDLTVENVHYPCLADVRRPSPDTEFFAFGAIGSDASRTMLWPRFENAMGFCSVERPTFANVKANVIGAVGVPVTPFLLLEDGRRGLYLGVDEPSCELVVWHGALDPGWRDSIDYEVPPDTTVGGHEVTFRIEAVHVPYVQPGETRRLSSIALQQYVGDWHAGADVYADRRREWMVDAPTPSWASDPHSWQQIQLNSPEDTLRLRFAELPVVAKECAQRGVKALQVVGWNAGGQDQNNPSHDPDPRLGGAEELRRAIAECQALGVKVVLFTKFVWSDRATDRFRNELVELAVKDPYGDYYVVPGFRYDTVTQLLDINTKRFVPMCFHSDRWLDVCEQEFAKVLELGADGILNDEAYHHSPALVCFDESHGHRIAAPVYARDRELVRRFRRSPAADRPEFLYGAEACYDWMFEAYQLSYSRSNFSSHVPLARYLHPRAQMMTAVSGFEDRSMINQCLLYRYIVSYEPFNFKGRLTDFDATVGYGQLMDALRTELREWFWDGDFRDTVGASVTDVEGRAHRDYAVFTSAHGGPSALAIANYGTTSAVRLRVEVDGGAERYRYRLVDDEVWRDVQPHIVLPPRSAAVVVPA